MGVHVSQLYYYPIKSLAGISSKQLSVTRWGPHRDRRLMLVDEQGIFITQRQSHVMALISVIDDGDEIRLAYQGRDIGIAWPDFSLTQQTRKVEVWGEELAGQVVSESINEWLSQVLQRSVTLVYMADKTHRQVDTTYALQGTCTGFTDGFPFLIVSQNSINYLHQDLTFNLDAQRFRPNIVVAGCKEFSESSWKKIRINGLELNLIKPCSRCIIPCIDPSTGLMQEQVMQVLLAHCSKDGEVYFGQNALHQGEGVIAVGQEVELIN